MDSVFLHLIEPGCCCSMLFVLNVVCFMLGLQYISSLGGSFLIIFGVQSCSFGFSDCFRCLVMDSLSSMTHQRPSCRSLVDFAILLGNHLVVHLNIYLRFVWSVYHKIDDSFDLPQVSCMF